MAAEKIKSRFDLAFIRLIGGAKKDASRAGISSQN
jgi:hypothetical protein